MRLVHLNLLLKWCGISLREKRSVEEGVALTGGRCCLGNAAFGTCEVRRGIVGHQVLLGLGQLAATKCVIV